MCECRGVVNGADIDLPRQLRAEIIEMFAAALVADFLSDLKGFEENGLVPTGNEPTANEPAGRRLGSEKQ
jgi:hypothetical protein